MRTAFATRVGVSISQVELSLAAASVSATYHTYSTSQAAMAQVQEATVKALGDRVAVQAMLRSIAVLRDSTVLSDPAIDTEVDSSRPEISPSMPGRRLDDLVESATGIEEYVAPAYLGALQYCMCLLSGYQTPPHHRQRPTHPVLTPPHSDLTPPHFIHSHSAPSHTAPISRTAPHHTTPHHTTLPPFFLLTYE